MRLAALFALCCAAWAQPPRTWNEKDLADWGLPIAALGAGQKHFSEADYYKAPIDEYRSYPVYYPGREPAGYWESLQKKKAEPLIAPGLKRSQVEWIAAGKRVFEELDVAFFRSSRPEHIRMARSADELAKLGIKPRPDGSIFAFRWVITPKGLQLSVTECASCHVRLMPDGTLLHGAQPSEELHAGIGVLLRANEDDLVPTLYQQFGVPWLKDDPHERLKTMTPEESDEMFRAHPPGTFARFHGSPFFVTKMPDLIGIKDRKYLDATATHRHRGPGDIMRYAAYINTADSADIGTYRILTDKQRTIPFRFSDDALYALTMYIYSLRPPPNPHKFDALASAGQKLFAREGCTGCHTPPLYTNNKLTIASGYSPPANHPVAQDIMNVSVGTEPNLALKTRKGTGLYKIPSLRGLWYRGLLLHDGSVASLEEMFNPDRLRADHVPGGFKGYRVKTRAIPGHEFGLRLKPDDKQALIAFLKTL